MAQNTVGSNTSSSDVKILSPVESKVKPLKIPMKPKLVGTEDTRNEKSLGIPGKGLRINQSATAAVGEQTNNRVGRSSERRNVNFDNVVKRSKSCGGDADQMRRTSLDMENIASVKSRIETYLSSAAEAKGGTEQTSKQEPSTTANVKQPKSILVNRSEGVIGKKTKTPKLIHSGEGESKNLNIYAQSATDYSAEEDSSCTNREISNKLKFAQQQEHFLKVPQLTDIENGMLPGGVRKSKSFATPGQFECAMDDHQVNEKKRTMMAFFTSQQQTSTTALRQSNKQSKLSSVRKISQPAMHIQAGSGVELRNANNSNKNTPSVNTKADRSSITSISDEIIGDEDLRDVDAVFESLLNSTFSESESSSSLPGSKSG